MVNKEHVGKKLAYNNRIKTNKKLKTRKRRQPKPPQYKSRKLKTTYSKANKEPSWTNMKINTAETIQSINGKNKEILAISWRTYPAKHKAQYQWL